MIALLDRVVLGLRSGRRCHHTAGRRLDGVKRISIAPRASRFEELALFDEARLFSLHEAKQERRLQVKTHLGRHTYMAEPVQRGFTLPLPDCSTCSSDDTDAQRLVFAQFAIHGTEAI
jgi:hypothetical protein